MKARKHFQVGEFDYFFLQSFLEIHRKFIVELCLRGRSYHWRFSWILLVITNLPDVRSLSIVWIVS